MKTIQRIVVAAVALAAAVANAEALVVVVSGASSANADTSLANAETVSLSGSETVAADGNTAATAGNSYTEHKALAAWTVGRHVSLAAVQRYGLDKCFVSETIGSRIKERMYGRSYKKNCTVAWADLRYLRLLHYNAGGDIVLGEMVCHKDIAADLVQIFRALFDARYPIERMQLIDDYGADDTRSMDNNNTTCFNFRAIAGSKKLSNHSLGKAVDLNPLYNPYVKRRADGTLLVNPASGRRYADRSLASAYRIDRTDLACRLFAKHGFVWGGSWKSLKDYQHFEKK